MSFRSFRARWQYAALSLALVAAAVTLSHAGGGFIGGGNAVGGVVIDAAGVVNLPAQKDIQQRLSALRKALSPALADDLATPASMRKISLRRLEETILDHVNNRLPIPEDVVFLAGLQRIEYVFVYPDANDIVIAGPAEGWRVNEHAEVVGVNTGKPVMTLEDLLVAFRSAETSRQTGIRCSIDPTPEGRRRFQQAAAQVRAGANLEVVKKTLEQAFGPQTVTLAGVPESSHFARVLVAADYRMKRLAMNLEESPVKGLPSYPEMIRNQRNVSSATPRWWLACDYQPVTRSDDGLAWRIQGGVKAMTEDELIGADGSVTGTGKTSDAAAKWAAAMTERYDELSMHIASFGHLQNLMDLSVLAAVIEGHQLRSIAGCELPTLFQSDSPYKLHAYGVPRQMAPQCSMLKTAGGILVTASGGVDLNSWQVASRSSVNAQLAEQRAAVSTDKQWWWN